MVTRLPGCPGCKQGWTGVYNRRFGCSRCGTMGPIAKPPVPTAPVIDLMAALKTSLAADSANSTAVPV